MKKIIIILIIIGLIFSIAFGCWYIMKNKNGNTTQVAIDSNSALQIAQLKYENLLNLSQGNYMELALKDGMLEIFKFDGNNYYKITNYENSIKNNVADELLEDFKVIAEIIEKDGSYYISVDSIGREKNPDYDSTILIVESFSEEEIVCEAQSTYINYVSGGSSKLSHEFVLKKIDGVWKVTNFELPY